MITLRTLKKTDIERLVHLANNKNISRYLIDTFPFPYTKKDADWFLETGSSANGSVAKVIEYRDQFVGIVGITPETGWKKHIAEIGYWIAESYWGKNITPKALNIMGNFAFSELKYRKLFAPVLAPNKKSMRVLEKCDYTLEGVLKEEVLKDGHYFDVYHYSKHCP